MLTSHWDTLAAPAVRVIAFDADDTLWHSEDLFTGAHEALATALDIPRERLEDGLIAVESRNLSTYGFGAKSFALSAIEYIAEVAPPEKVPALIGEVLTHTREMLVGDVRLIDGPRVPAVLGVLKERGYVVGLITKGDYLVQSARLRDSGLRPLFDHVSIVVAKDEATYAEVFTEWGVEPQAVCMVGNSVRSDALPVLELGGRAVHIPYPHVWRLEAAELPESPRANVCHAIIDLLEFFPARGGTR